MKIHIAKQGDSLRGIAEKYQVEPEVLKEFNPALRESEQLVPGTKIKIPSAPRPVLGLGSSDRGEAGMNLGVSGEAGMNLGVSGEAARNLGSSDSWDTAPGPESGDRGESFGDAFDDLFVKPFDETMESWGGFSAEAEFSGSVSFPSASTGEIHPDWARMFYPPYPPYFPGSGFAGGSYPYFGSGGFYPYSGSGYPGVEPARSRGSFFPEAGADPFYPAEAMSAKESAGQTGLTEEGKTSPRSGKTKRPFVRKSARKQGEGKEGGRFQKESEKSSRENAKVNLPWINV